MALQTRLRDLVVSMGTQIKSIRMMLNGNMSDLSTLRTKERSNFVGAINELKDTVDGKQGALGFTPESTANKGVAGGYAPLDGMGRIPSANLPSYVDDVIEYDTFAKFPAQGESGKLYIDMATDREYRWSGTAYRQIIASPGTSDNVIEGTSNLYFTNDRAKAALAPVLGDTETDLVKVFTDALA